MARKLITLNLVVYEDDTVEVCINDKVIASVQREGGGSSYRGLERVDKQHANFIAAIEDNNGGFFDDDGPQDMLDHAFDLGIELLRARTF